MNYRTRISHLLGFCALSATLIFTPFLSAQTSTSTHSLTLNNVVQSVDAHGRVVLVAAVRGDLAGVLTLALVVKQNGTVTGGEWALDASRIELGPPGTDGDGDPVETLVRLGFLKGTVTGGSVSLGDKGLATALSGVQLNVTRGTVRFAAAKSGSGSVGGANLNLEKASNGFLTITF